MSYCQTVHVTDFSEVRAVRLPDCILVCPKFQIVILLDLLLTDLSCVLLTRGLLTYSRYSDSLRAARSGDRIPVGARFSAPVQTGPGAHPACYTMNTGFLSRGKSAGSWR